MKEESIIWILIKIMALAVIGPFTYSIYSMPVVIAAFLAITAIFFVTLFQKQYFSFLMQLFICNHFTYGYEIGGTFNLVAFVALFAYLFLYGSEFFSETTLSKTFIFLISMFLVIQIFSLINSGTPTGLKVGSFFVLFNFFFLFYFCSKIKIDTNTYPKFIKVTAIYFIYMFILSINQRYEYFVSPYEFFPNTGPNANWEFGIPRSAGTLGNFEYYAEYSISMIALCLPGLLSGTFKKVSLSFFASALALMVLSVLAIVLSGTRSSILLLPFLIIAAVFFLGRRLRITNIAIGVAVTVIFFAVNSVHTIVDFSIFSKRSEEVDMKHVSLSSIMSGKDMNRGDIFAYGFKKMEQASVLFGDGFFANRKQYVINHFGRVREDDIPDYHNLYMSSVVLWGYLGACILVFFFFYSMYKGFKLYSKLKKQNFFLVDLLLGFNLLFLFFMVNQFKIQFIRDTNYFMLMLLLLVFYNSLIHLLSQKIVVVPTNQIKLYENSNTAHNL